VCTANEPGVTNWRSRSSSRLNKIFIRKRSNKREQHQTKLTPSVLDVHRYTVVEQYRRITTVRNRARIYVPYSYVVVLSHSFSTMYRIDLNARMKTWAIRSIITHIRMCVCVLTSRDIKLALPSPSGGTYASNGSARRHYSRRLSMWTLFFNGFYLTHQYRLACIQCFEQAECLHVWKILVALVM
jgi:hypothetical protein